MLETFQEALDPYLAKQVDNGISGLDIMHGHLKTLMHEAEQSLERAQATEDLSGDAMDSMERTYAEGYLDALTAAYQLTYHLSFAIAEK